MTHEQYLREILKEQTLLEESKELAAIRGHRAKVESILRDRFGAAPTIRYGGSKAKGTMIREAYDLDILCYFGHEDSDSGENLAEIYGNVRDALSEEYYVETKTSALRLRGKSPEEYMVDFHVDVVPGRFIDNSKQDVFLHCTSGDKQRLKTNPQVHIDHVKDSGVRDAIRLMKLWRVRNGILVKHFVLELLVVDLLKQRKSASLPKQLYHVLTEIRDNSSDLHVEDPANPTGNDLSELLDDTVRALLANVARVTLALVDSDGWVAVFGQVEDAQSSADRVNILHGAAAAVARPTRPWFDGS